MEHEGSLPRAQDPSTGLYSEPYESSSYFHVLFFKIHFSH
jgi:hypothetical protein